MITLVVLMTVVLDYNLAFHTILMIVMKTNLKNLNTSDKL